MNKKGIFALLLFVLVILLMVYALFTFLTSKPSRELSVVGEGSINLTSLYNYGEISLLKVEQAAKYAAFDSIIELTNNAGTNGECGFNNGVVYLESKDKLCYFDRERIKENFEIIFNKNLRKYLDKYNGVEFPNYDIELEDNLKIKTMGNITIKEGETVYIADSDFTTEIEFDFDGFIKLMDDIKTIRDNKCVGADTTKACWESELNKYSGYSFVISENNNLFIFEATADKGLKNFFWEKEVILKFIIDNSGGFKQDA